MMKSKNIKTVCLIDDDCEIKSAEYCCSALEACFKKNANPGIAGDLDAPNCICFKRLQIKEVDV